MVQVTALHIDVIGYPAVSQSAFKFRIAITSGYGCPALQTDRQAGQGLTVAREEQTAAAEQRILRQVALRLNTGCDVKQVQPHMGIQLSEIARAVVLQLGPRTSRYGLLHPSGQLHAEVIVVPSVRCCRGFHDAHAQASAIGRSAHVPVFQALQPGRCKLSRRCDGLQLGGVPNAVRRHDAVADACGPPAPTQLACRDGRRDE